MGDNLAGRGTALAELCKGRNERAGRWRPSRPTVRRHCLLKKPLAFDDMKSQFA